jgi:hypothetical protein
MSRVFKLRVTCDNAAFGETKQECHFELARLLMETADLLDRGVCGVNTVQLIRDLNGNTVGTFELVKEEDQRDINGIITMGNGP